MRDVREGSMGVLYQQVGKLVLIAMGMSRARSAKVAFPIRTLLRRIYVGLL